jgi:ribosomal protein L11 methyltransferase
VAGTRRTWPALDVRALDDPGRDLVLAILDDFHPTAVDDLDTHSIRAFFVSESDRDAACRAVSARYECESADVSDEAWAERSQANLRAVRAGQLTIAPPWDLPAVTDWSRTIVIEPSMGFGTGHHATTRLCLRAMQTLALDGTSVIDVGTGSGVLAIAAVRLGAAEVVAIDTDPDAITCAQANVAANRVADRVALAVADVCDPAAGSQILRTRGRGSNPPDLWKTPTFDLVTANLTGTLLRAASERLVRLARVDGYLVLSGFLLSEEDDVAAAFAPPARLSLRDQEEDWGVLVFRRTA